LTIKIPLSSSAAPIRLMSISRVRACLAAFIVFVSSALPGVAAPPSDGEPILKLDVPKMDQMPQHKTLKGGVFHHETLAPKPSKLQAGASNLKANVKAQDSKLKSQAPKKGLLNLFKGKASHEKASEPPLNALAQTGVGIIGVKFVIGFGLPPTINKVFPGTPAYQAGLRNNDVIVAVDGVPTSGLTKEEVYAMIVGLPDTPVTVSVLRHGDFIAKTMNRMDFNDIPDPDVKQDYLMSI